MILPSFGIISAIVPAFSRKRLFGYSSMVYATASIAGLSFLVWAHHMFTTGMPVFAELFFMFCTMLISVPTGVKVFNWVATMWRGSLTFEVPMLFAIAFIVLFTIGGFFWANVGDHAGRFSVSRHLLCSCTLPLCLGFRGGVFNHGRRLLLAAKMDRHMFNETLAQWHFWCSVISVNILFFPMHFFGACGDATPDPGLCAPICRCKRDCQYWRLRLWPVATHLFSGGDSMRAWRRACCC